MVEALQPVPNTADAGSSVRHDDVEISAFGVLGAGADELLDYIKAYRSYSIPRPRMMATENVHLVGPQLICIDSDGHILIESFRGEKGVRRAGFLSRTGSVISWDRETVSTVEMEKAVAVGGKASGEFFHWMVEIVPRLMMVKESPALKNWPLLMRPITRQYQHDSIEALGLLPVFIKQDVIALKTLSFPTHLVHQKGRGWISPQLIGMAKRFAEQYLHVSRSGPGRRIYVSRGDAPKRKVANEVEVQQLLASHGFESVELSTLSLREQVALFCNAEVVVGLHGAGLASVMFCNPGARLIELYPQRFIAVSPFWNLASLNGMDYRMVMCEALTSKLSTHDADVRVNLEWLTQALKALKVA